MSLKPLLSKSFTGKIWNVEISPAGELLAIEVRNPEVKTVSFNILNLLEKNWVWESVEFEENWWLSLVAIEEEYIYLDYFTKKDNPDNKKTIKVDVQKLEVIEEFESYESTSNKPMDLPVHYLEGSENYEKVAAFLKQHSNEEIVKAVDYLQTQSAIAISYYLYQEGSLANFLLILDAKGNELERKLLHENLEHIGMQTFFRVGDFLITIVKNTELLIYTL